MTPEEHRDNHWRVNGYKGTKDHRESKGMTLIEYEVWLRSPSSQQGQTNGEREEQRIRTKEYKEFMSTPEGKLQAEFDGSIRVELHNIINRPYQPNILERRFEANNSVQYRRKKLKKQLES